ncbi:MAG TPA: PAS domain-containing protein [Usitatibacteraceae bacterium]|nr:PAS domain-containing protein [Usitatibacteraceae bacterium]
MPPSQRSSTHLNTLPAAFSTDWASVLARRGAILQRLTDKTGRPVLYVDREHCLRFTNQPFLDWMQRTRAEVLDQHASVVFGQAGYQFYAPFLRRAESGEICEAETQSKVRTDRHIRVAFLPDLMEDGRAAGTYVLVHDVEDEYQVRQQLVAKEAEQRAVLDSIGIPVSRSDRELRYRFVNRVACEWFGWSAEQMLGRTWAEVIGEDQFSRIRSFAERALAGESVAYTREASFRNRRDIVIRVQMFPERDLAGSVVGVYVSITDVAQDYRLQKELADSERRIRMIADGVGIPINYVDTNWRVTYYNRPCDEMYAREFSNALGRHIRDVLPQAVFEQIEPHYLRAFSGERVEYERLAEVKGRGNRWVRVNLLPDFGPSQAVVGVYSVVADIHEDVLLRETLMAQERQLRLFADNIPESIAYIAADGRYRFVNNAFLRRRGFSRHEVIGRSYQEILAPLPAAETVIEHYRRALAGEPQAFEREVTHADAGRRGMKFVLVPDIDATQRVQGVYAMGIDVTDLQVARDEIAERENELRVAMDSLPHPMVYLDASLRYRLINRRVEEMFGLPREQLVGRDLKEVFGERRYLDAKVHWDRALAGETFTVERQIGTDPKTMRWMLTRYTPRTDGDGRVIGLYIAGTDIDDLKRTEINLRRANWLLTSHFENTPLAVIEWDAEFRVLRWSPQAERIFGWNEAEVRDLPRAQWKFVVEGDREQAEAVFNRMVLHHEPRTSSLHRNYRKDGRIIWCEWYHSSLRDEDGRIVSVLSLAQDVTTRVLAEERLVHQATHDSLTGLPNRTMLQDRLRLAISRARRTGHRVAALFIDLDRFKEVNDTLGHRIGDELLCEMSARLGRMVRDVDLLVRLSGDEFMIVLEEVTDLESPRVVAAKLLDEIRLPTRIKGHDIHVSASIGISLFPDDAEDVDSLMKNADMAMYRAKELGKNAFELFSADLAARGSAMRLMESALRSAVVRNELELYFQPKVSLADGVVTGAEALLRWHHPTRGMVGPAEFMPLAEETGLIHEIGDWVLNASCRQLSQWQESGLGHLHLAVNLSAGQFQATQLARRVMALIEREGCNPKNLELEITETGMLRDPEGVGKTLSALREHGIRVAIDDFGTGYSSLSHLKRFPIDTLKIDRTFVADMERERGGAAIVAAVIALARALEIRVVAEGVESEDQLSALRALGCDAYQGYLFSRPVPREEFEAIARRAR